MKIIDVSEHNGVIDWAKVKPYIDGAIIRCGYGRDLANQDDKQWKRNADECTRLGIPFGVYIYSYAKTVDSAKSEALHVLRLVKGYKLSFPIYFDAEQKGTESVCKANAIAFGDVIEKAGYWCGVYSTAYWFNHYMPGLNRFTKWIAAWGTNNGKPQNKPSVLGMDMWQYTSVGKVPGISGNVDMSECYRDFPKFLNQTKKEPVVDNRPWYEKDGSWAEATKLGIVDGKRPTENATRAEVAKMILTARKK
jgi:lysozyme